MANGSGVKTNERPGTRAVAKYIRISPYKVREVLDLIRGQHVQRAAEILRFSERDAAFVVGKVLASAVANAENNDGIDPEELYVSACYADEGVTIKRFRPRARGRAGRIRKRTCHVTVIVSRMPADQLARFRTKQAAEQQARRARRVAGGRGGDAAAAGGRGGRFRRNRGGEAPANEPEVLDEVEQEQVEAVNADVEAADEVDAVDNSPVSDEVEVEADEAGDDETSEDEATTDEEESN
jgi:large subunit ribosomal protein L22